MMKQFLTSSTHIYLACGSTDFRKQLEGLSSLVTMKFGLDPFQEDCVFLFCNKKRNAIKVLRYDRNGFILAQKKLLDEMKFQWPSKQEEVKLITKQQVEWLLEGLEIEQKKAHHSVAMSSKTFCY